MTLRLRRCVLLIVGLGVAPAQAGPTIRVYTDLAGTQCTGTTVNGVLQGSVWANDADGLAGAAFAVYCTLEGDFLLTFTLEPSTAVQIGDPFYWGRNGGTNIAFSTCQTGSRVRLFTFLLVENAPTHDIALRIIPRSTPWNPYILCPQITLCDGPVYKEVYVNEPWYRGEPEAIINPRDDSPVLCPSTPLSVSPVNWSAVKNLYR